MDNSPKHIELILKYIRRELAGSDRKKVEKLLNSDKEFRKMHDMIKTLGIDCLPGNLAELTPSLKQLSLNMFREFQKTKDDKKGHRGLPVYDSQVLPAPQGVRPSKTNSRRLKYKFDDLELELSLYPVSLYSYEIIGQLSGTDKEEYRVELVGNNFRKKTKTDELQMFVFARVPAMKYRVNILSGKNIKAFIDVDL